MNNFATLDEVWGPEAQLARVPANPFHNKEYQRQVLNSSASVGIVPREPQILDAGSVQAYLDQLYRESGPVAVSALLPASYVRPVRPPLGLEEDEDPGMDTEALFLGILAGFAALVLFDNFS